MSDLDGWFAKAESGLVDDMEKVPYVSAAMDELKKRKKYWNEQRVLHGSNSLKCANSGSESCSPPPIGFASIKRENPEVRNDIPEADFEEKLIAQPKLEESDEAFPFDQTAGTSPRPEENTVELSSSCEEYKCLEGHSSRFRDIKNHDSYSFYQAVDGQNIILHPLNMKCLLHHWGSYVLLPNRLSGRILQLETVTQTEAMRRRYRYLSHFSLTTTFQLCEIDISEVLPGDALLPFVDEIKKRESERKRNAKKERKEKLKAEATAEIPLSVQFDIGQPSTFGPPTFSKDDFEALCQPNILSTSPPVNGERKTFSNVTRLGFAAGHDSPSLKREGMESVDQTTTIKGGSNTSNVPSFANMISKGKPVGGPETGNKGNEMARKGKKSSQVLLSTAGGRRY
ncbi:hypothetical protein MLD38_000275 [Melastoma candidum]|uniref:Uncharacterized protein n=1 Tax=Melastoma candidum TaxID=119954 RepID=A0ACB9S959_9MYRT|nr:hypothetical protein MLD38_000275 [Melastoma candidum]